MSKGGLWLDAAIGLLGVLVCVPLAGVFGYKWLARRAELLLRLRRRQSGRQVLQR